MRGAEAEAELETTSSSASRLFSIILSSKHFLCSHDCPCPLSLLDLLNVDKWPVSPILIVALSFAHHGSFNAKLCSHRPSFVLIGSAGRVAGRAPTRDTC
jgi:hypothetical protein